MHTTYNDPYMNTLTNIINHDISFNLSTQPN